MSWCAQNGVDYIGLAGTKLLTRKVDAVAGLMRTEQAVIPLAVLRGCIKTRYRAET